MREIKIGKVYKHFKNKLYVVLDIVNDSESNNDEVYSKVVIYQALYGDNLKWARPYDMFNSEVDHEKYPDVTQKYRFTKVKFVTKIEENIQDEKEKKEEASNEVKQKVLENNQAKILDEKDERLKKQPYSAEELFYQFLNANTYKEKLEIFRELRDKADARILTNIAVSLDLVVEDDNLEEQYTIIRQNLETYAKFECNRLR